METQDLEKTYEITGMTCAACVARVEKAIRKIPEVKEVAVNLATERARIVFTKPVEDQIVSAFVHKTGYEAKRFIINATKEIEDSSAKNATLKNARLQFVLAALFTLPLLVPMAAELFGFEFKMEGALQAALAAIVQFGFGFRFYRGAYFAIRSRSPNMDVLVCLGTLSAFALSLYYLIVHGSAHPHFYFETGAFITTLVMLGKYLETEAKSETGAAIQKLKKLRPEQVTRIRDGIEEVVALALVRKGDLIRIRPGEVIPADGKVIRGKSEVNEALLTGESLPALKSEGSLVSGGSVNADGVLEIELLGDSSESLLSRMIALIEKAQEKKAPIQRLADQVSAVFVPVVLGLALLTLILWGVFTHDWERALMHAVGVLVIACPCALGLATPTAIRVGMGSAARKGILIRDAEVLETLHSLQEVAFDKTGTLTEGNFSVTSLQLASGVSEQAFLKIVASLQSQSEHPLAKAVLKKAKESGISFTAPTQLRAVAGQGVEGSVESAAYFFGNEKAICDRGGVFGIDRFSDSESTKTTALFENTSVDFSKQSLNQNEPLEMLSPSHNGETISFLLDLNSKQVLGEVHFSDSIREHAKEAVKALQDQSIRVVLLSGDRIEAATRVGKLVGADEIKSPFTPEEKTNFIRSKVESGKRIGMVGDGLNDGPALASASVGFALSTGTDVSISVAGVTLLRPDLRLVGESIELSKLIYRKIKQNLFWAFAYNVLGIPLAALGYLSPMVAGGAMALSSVSVVLNSLSLQRREK